ncbi:MULTISPECIES: DUF3108 domain-containing protein [Alcanivorax]|uniref:DUF3108 domain-containing protein n=1 Tax=Alcanivorax TaxID=59753 RepID=UPI0025BA3118|nr:MULTISPECIES: DUF3108 domain-containing protein [Alcanivorax]
MANHSLNRVFNWSSSLLLILALAAPASHAEPPVAPFTLDYHLKSEGIPFTFTATRTLKPVRDGLWKMEVQAKNWLGEIRETTLFDWQQCIPETTYYGYYRRGLGRVKEAKLHLDREAGVAASERTDKPMRSYPITDEATDELSVSLALQCALQTGKRDIKLQVADERSLEAHRYRVVGQEQLKIDGKQIETVKVQRQRGANSKRQTYMWFAPQHDYLLVQLLQENSDGDHVMTLQSMEGL